VITSQYTGEHDRAEREAYVDRHYSRHWFDFAPLCDVACAPDASPATPPSGRLFHGFKPAFVHRYCRMEWLTPEQIVEVGLLYLDRARRVLALGD
jgi:hypothetical protein